MNWLEISAQIAEIGTAVVAIVGGGSYAINLVRKRIALENYLRKQKQEKPLGRDDHGRRTIKHLVAYLKMSDEEVLKAAFRSKKIDPKPLIKGHMVEDIYLEYNR
jgi:hypothetical protein